MTAPKPDLGDVLLGAMLGEWREDIESVPFPSMTDLLIPRAQQRTPAHPVAGVLVPAVRRARPLGSTAARSPTPSNPPPTTTSPAPASPPPSTSKDPTAMSDYGHRVTALLRWASTQDAPARAAIDLLVEQGSWFRNRKFVDHCVAVDEGITFVQWWRAQELLDNDALIGSSGELAVLRFAVALVRDPNGLSSLDRTNKALAVRALAAALGVVLP